MGPPAHNIMYRWWSCHRRSYAFRKRYLPHFASSPASRLKTTLLKWSGRIPSGAAYVIAIEPRIPNKYLTRGRIWVDADEFAIVRVEGKPAKNPSFWTKSVHFVHDYDKSGSFRFPVSDRSVTDVRIFGATEMTIEYFDYMPNGSPPQPDVGIN